MFRSIATIFTRVYVRTYRDLNKNKLICLWTKVTQVKVKSKQPKLLNCKRFSLVLFMKLPPKIVRNGISKPLNIKIRGEHATRPT